MKNHTSLPIIYIVLPCYNEQEVILEAASRLAEFIKSQVRLKSISAKSKIFFVDDGSTDATWSLIQSLANKQSKIFGGLKLSRNHGHQNALLAGLLTAKQYADACISMDVDLQDDIKVLSKFIAHYKKGVDIVYGVRSSRSSDSWFKRTSALVFYRLVRLIGIGLVYNHADFRLMSRRTLDELEGFSEVNLFLRGLVPLLGFKQATVKYKRLKRLAGQSKYPLKKMLSFTLDGITSFSVKPIRVITVFGCLMFVFSMVVLAYAIVVKIMGHVVDGWTFIICSVWLLAAIQMISLGVIGEYIGKIYSETKARPRYIIEKILLKK
jgi:glycosyltransferase involved in cell wall biosynthesis